MRACVRRLCGGAQAALLLGALLPDTARADVALPAIFGAHMVLPADRALPFWGTASPGERVTVSAAGRSASAVADAAGRWRLELPALVTDAPFEVVVAGNNRIVLPDVVLGEVWLASGQSNMEWPLHASDATDLEVLSASAPKLRLFQVRRPAADKLANAPVPVRGRWTLVTPEAAARFSAVAYHFGRALAERRPRPIGLVQAAWGGSRIEPWIRRATLAQRPADRAVLAALSKGPDTGAAEEFRRALAAWDARRQVVDPGDRGSSLGWARAGGTGWRAANLPTSIEAAAGRPVDGAVWFRRTVELPSAFVGQPLLLRLGALDECDTTWVDGTLVGGNCGAPVAPETIRRAYRVPASLTRARRLTIAVRIFDPGGPGGFLGGADALRLVLGDAPDGPALALDGPWQWQIEHEVSPGAGAGDRPQPPAGFATYQSPGVLFDNQIADLVGFPFRGVIWYQGESNAREAGAYRTLLPLLMADWRQAFAQPKLPFLITQLAAHRPWVVPGAARDDDWPRLREVQAEVAASDPASGLAVTIDLGARDDIHPRNKREVGRRLALAALAGVYGEKVTASGPVYLAQRRQPGQLRLQFGEAFGLRAATGDPERPTGFEIAGADRRFVAAAARVEGDAVILSAPGLDRPLHARYAWADDPVCNLINGAGLPAIPFRTDAPARDRRPPARISLR